MEHKDIPISSIALVALAIGAMDEDFEFVDWDKQLEQFEQLLDDSTETE